MSVKREQWNYRPGNRVWVGRYRNSQNMLHWHYDCELLYVEKGCLHIFCNQTLYTVSSGNSFFIDSKQVHYMNAQTPQTIVSMIVFDYEIISPFATGKTLPTPLLTHDYDVLGLFRELKREITECKDLYEHYACYKIALFMLEVIRGEGFVSKKKNRHAVERFKGLLTEIENKFEFYTLNEAADFMGMNATYFSRLFHKLTGMTFSQYLNYIKVKHAVELLQAESDLGVTEISLKSGFNTIRNFNRIFKEFTGFAPSKLPKDFIMPEKIPSLNDISTDPTLLECELLESSNDAPPPNCDICNTL